VCCGFAVRRYISSLVFSRRPGLSLNSPSETAGPSLRLSSRIARLKSMVKAHSKCANVCTVSVSNMRGLREKVVAIRLAYSFWSLFFIDMVATMAGEPGGLGDVLSGLVVGGWWLVVGGWWLVVDGWWLVVGSCLTEVWVVGGPWSVEK
jgi:hypothetical protein